MSFNPLTHTSGIGVPGPDTTPIRGSEDRREYNSALPGQNPVPVPQQPSSKKRRPSKGKVPAEIRRSSSTPHMRNLALGASGDLSPTGDKRRNKLGYHRTSVACGHCRRRKIRCLLANDDPQGRCANCIRLKKECNFYPVEQNPEAQRSQSNTSKEASTGAPTSSTTSSPRHPASMSSEKIDEFRPPFPGAAPGQHPPRYPVQGEHDIEPHQAPSSGGMPMQHPQFAYPHAIETQRPPSTGFLPSSSIAESPSSTTGYWRPSPSTANSAYGSESNVSGGHTPAAMSTSSTMSFGHQDSHNWNQPSMPPPTRSMSYGNIEGIPQQYPGQGLGIQQHEFSRRTSPYPYPTTIDTNPSTIHTTSLGGATSAPLSAPILPNQQYPYPQTWSPYGAVQNPPHEMPIPGRSMSAQWGYAEPGQLDQVQEEGGPTMTYSHPGVQQFYSGP